MEKIALRILDILSDVRLTVKDIDYLAWHLVYHSPKPMQKRLLILADAIQVHHHTIMEEDNNDQYTLF